MVAKMDKPAAKSSRGRGSDAVGGGVLAAAGGAGEDVEEVDDVLVFGEDAVVVKVDVGAGGAYCTAENIEKVDDVLVFGEDGVVVEVDGVAEVNRDDEGGGSTGCGAAGDCHEAVVEALV